MSEIEPYDVPVCRQCHSSCDQCDCVADELRAALARETERAEKAERERDEARAARDKAYQSTAVYKLALDAAAEERDRLRNEVDCVAQQVIDWSKRASEAERRLAALSHLGTGAGRRAG